MDILDISIVVVFLAVTLALGIVNSKKIKTVQDYALGGRKFSTGTLVATIVATTASASGFFTDLNSTYTDGLFYIIPGLCFSVSLLIIAYIFVPRMGEFLGNNSVAEVMGKIYGKEARIITAIAGTIAAVGSIAVQFKAFGNITAYFTSISTTEAIIISGVIVTAYSAVGGITAVTRTDILQFFTFGVVIPIIAVTMWNQMYYTNHSVSHVFISNNFKFSELTNTDNPKFWAMVSLIFYFTIPSLRPAAFQRILIGSSISQVKKAFTISAFLLTFVMLTTCWIAFLALSMNDNLRPDQLLGFIIDKYSYSGFKGLITIGIIAMAMSTADSILNATAVLFSNDILAPLNIGVNRQLLISKLFSVGLGFCAIIFAFYGKDLLSIILLANSFYMPIVTVPLLLTIVGFRSTRKSVLVAMVAGFIVVLAGNIFEVKADTILIGMLINMIVLFGFHYLFKQAGGWVGIKDYSYLESSKKEKSRMIVALVRNIQAFSFIEFCKERAPKDELNYMWLGIYFIIYGFSTMYSTRLELVGDQSRVIVVVYQIMMVTGVLMAMYPIWPPRIKHEIIVQVAWYIVIFYMLIVFAVFFVMVNKFGQLQFALFVLNILIATILTGWRLGIGMSVVGFYFGLELYKYYAGINEIDFTVGSPEFVSIYVVILAGAVLLMFFKPKEEYQELTEEKNEHLSGRINMYKDQVREAEALKGRFIRNITHEYHAPMTGISSMAQVLVQDYDKLNDEQRKIAAKTILDSSLRLEVFDANISSLSKLNKPSYELKLVPTDFSVLVEDRVTLCRKLYENEEERIINRQAARESNGRKWQLDIEEGIVLNIDKYYMSQALDNLIINSINYAKSGTIGINLKRDKDKEAIVFSISDEGIGIPPEELEEVFEEFTVSSRTESFAGGRGVGLAVCKKVIEVHGGAIKAESKKMGTRISFTLPYIRRV